MSIKKVTECPKKKGRKLKGWKCKRCDFYNPQKWYSINGEVEVFCGFDMNPNERSYIKTRKKPKKVK